MLIAVALVNMGRVEESLPLFRKVFAMDRNWITLTPRLPKSGLLPDDPKLIDRILALAVLAQSSAELRVLTPAELSLIKRSPIRPIPHRP